jgi:hypothetical protein
MVREFLKTNKLIKLIISHNVDQSGYEKYIDSKIISVCACTDTDYYGKKLISVE